MINDKEIQTHYLFSTHLGRELRFEVYGLDRVRSGPDADLLLINDGQDLIGMNFQQLLSKMQTSSKPLVCVGIHAGIERKQEYGVAGFPDHLKRGSKADSYSRFVTEELLPFFYQHYSGVNVQHRFFAGFSLGGLMAFDVVMDHPELFRASGVFSGSFWWRSKELGPGYSDDVHRIMHAKVRGKKKEALRFFFQTGQLDEKADRNNNGVIDSIDDTLDIIKELQKIGYQNQKDIEYVELPAGRHDIPTWKKGLPRFLDWLGKLPK